MRRLGSGKHRTVYWGPRYFRDLVALSHLSVYVIYRLDLASGPQ